MRYLIHLILFYANNEAVCGWELSPSYGRDEGWINLNFRRPANRGLAIPLSDQRMEERGDKNTKNSFMYGKANTVFKNLPSDNSSSNSASFSRTSSGNRVTSTLGSAIAVIGTGPGSSLYSAYHD